MTFWQPGLRLGPYELISIIGAGGMGEVWKARDTRLARVVAIKRMKGEYSERFAREARAIAALNHPHICTLYDVGPGYLVMEFVEGTPLKGPLPAEEALSLALQIAEAIREAHGRGILHRDIKPANILVTEKSGIKVLDFGLAKLAESEPEATMLTAGQAVGTPAYMSPEQAEGKPVDERSDVFSFGSLLYELLSGRQAFDGLAAVLRDQPPPLSSPLGDVVRRCLAKPPADRFQSMAEVAAALRLRLVAGSPSRTQPSIAVLPFANMSGDKEQEYFSDGLAEEIINALAQIAELKVIARTSAFAFKGQNADVRRVAETLGVTNILEGSVRTAGKRIRVTAQLINAADGTHLWSQRYDRDLEDVFAVQDEIASAVASALRVKLGTGPAVHVPKPEAHEALLKGRHHLFKLTPESMILSREYLMKAVEIDPGYGAAHAWLSEYFYSMVAGTYVLPPSPDAEQLARAAAIRAVELDPSCREAYAVLCGMAAVFDHDWIEAERHFMLATAGDAAPPEARRMCGFNYLLTAGRCRDAARQMELALQSDPLNTFIAMQLGVCLHAAGDSEQAFRYFAQAVELEEKNWLARLNQGFWFLECGQLEEAERAFELARTTVPGNRLVTCCNAAIHTLKGEQARARELLAAVESSTDYGAETALFSYYNLIGDFEKAAELAAKAIRQRDGSVSFVAQFAICRGLRSSPHWPRLARMLNLPEAVFRNPT
jgi:serine/threonine-protein kinase